MRIAALVLAASILASSAVASSHRESPNSRERSRHAPRVEVVVVRPDFTPTPAVQIPLTPSEIARTR